MTIIILPMYGNPYVYNLHDINEPTLCDQENDQNGLHKLDKWNMPFEVSPLLRTNHLHWDAVGTIIDIWSASVRKNGYHSDIEVFVDNNLDNRTINMSVQGTYINMIIQEPTGILVPDLSIVAQTPHNIITIYIKDRIYKDIITYRHTFHCLYIRNLKMHWSYGELPNFQDEPRDVSCVARRDTFEADRYENVKNNKPKDSMLFNVPDSFQPPIPKLNGYTQRRVEPYYDNENMSCFCNLCLLKKMPYTMANL